LGSFAGTISLSVTASGLSITLYLKERREHRATRERLAAEKEVLEKLLDARRTSSLLTPEGQDATPATSADFWIMRKPDINLDPGSEALA
jgi:hypothetical protein